MLKTANPHEAQPTTVTNDVVPTSRRPLRLWLPIAMLALFWAFLYAHYTLEMDMFPRFMSRMVAYGLLLLGFLTWWFTRRQLSLRDRLLAVGFVIVASVVTGLLSDSSVDPFVLFMTVFPFVFTAWTLWLLVSRNGSPRVQRGGFCVVMALVIGFFGLLRWDGLQGNQIPQFSWRWSKTPEQLFLEANTNRGDNTIENSRSTTTVLQPASVRDWSLQPGDWPEFRGHERNGVVSGASIDIDWTANPPAQVWRRRVGPAWSSMIVVDGFLVTQMQKGEAETVVCYDAATGEKVWVYSEPQRFAEGLSGAGPRGTPTFSSERIYAVGGTGQLVCLAASNGKLLWSHDIARESDADLPTWGYSVSPLIVDDKVVVFAGGKSGRCVLAYDAATGEPAWSREAGATSYSSPHFVSIDGRPQILMHDNTALSAFDPADGALLWQRPEASEMTVATLQPHVCDGNALLLAAEPGMVLINAEAHNGRWTCTDQWSSRSLKPSFNDFVVYGDHIYGLDDGILTCVDLADGKRLWKEGRYGHGQLLLLRDQGLLLILCENGEVVLVEANIERLDELGRFQAIEGKTWNHPVISHGQLFVRNGEEMASYRLK
jgi:outer membrane protein assembly factor BamB